MASSGGSMIRRSRNAIAVWAVAAGAIAVGVVLTLFAFLGPAAPPSRPTIVSILPPAETRELRAPAVSPDGLRVAFVARDSAGVPALWIRALDTPIGRLLAGTQGAAYPFWSPDSRLIGF